jgi:hypothetical protein
MGEEELALQSINYLISCSDVARAFPLGAFLDLMLLTFRERRCSREAVAALSLLAERWGPEARPLFLKGLQRAITQIQRIDPLYRQKIPAEVEAWVREAESLPEETQTGAA